MPVFIGLFRTLSVRDGIVTNQERRKTITLKGDEKKRMGRMRPERKEAEAKQNRKRGVEEPLNVVAILKAQSGD